MKKTHIAVDSVTDPSPDEGVWQYIGNVETMLFDRSFQNLPLLDFRASRQKHGLSPDDDIVLPVGIIFHRAGRLACVSHLVPAAV